MTVFSDRAKVNVAGGRGGNGCLSFRREKHVPRGGPDGGDGGSGGSVYVTVDPQLRDLSPYQRRVHFKAGSGRHGQGARKDGGRGDDFDLHVPLGTQVWLDGALLGDLTDAGRRVLVAAGGRGGRGNTRFVSATRQAPAFAERGDEGEEAWIELTLKLMADVGLAGLPNAGKSSLLRRISNAAPKVADYPFTTLEPLLGVVEVPGEEAGFTVADVPGLLEGASEGVGLGHEFLAHLERCHLILHLVDATGYYGSSPKENFRTIVAELDAHTPNLGRTPQLVVVNKVDATDETARVGLRAVFAREVQRLRTEAHPAFCWERAGVLPETDDMVWLISAVSGEGIPALVRYVGSLVREREGAESTWAEGRQMAGASDAPAPAPAAGRVPSPVPAGLIDFGDDADWVVGGGGSGDVEHVVYRPSATASGPPFTIRREVDCFVVESEVIARIVHRYDLENPQAVRYLGDRLERLGVYGALRDQGAVPGDEVHIGDLVFEFE